VNRKIIQIALRDKLIQRIQNVHPTTFDQVALEVFRYQVKYNKLYAEFIKLLAIKVDEVSKIEQIPFLPIAFFKNKVIKSGQWEAQSLFTSSGTTGSQTSRHELRSLDWYLQCARRGFENFYGPLEQYCILALLPSYLERSGSSLVYMVEQFVKYSAYEESDFFLYDTDRLRERLKHCQQQKIPTILIGVSFALLDFAEQGAIDLQDIILMETGGMKGRRAEITRSQLHAQLGKAFQLDLIHSEYGMTELLSQAYSKGNGIFKPAPTLKVLCREITDPLWIRPPGKSGLINLIDLANIDTCSFIATDDLGIVYADGAFEVLGRLDHSDIRGCNLLISEV